MTAKMKIMRAPVRKQKALITKRKRLSKVVILTKWLCCIASV